MVECVPGMDFTLVCENAKDGAIKIIKIAKNLFINLLDRNELPFVRN